MQQPKNRKYRKDQKGVSRGNARTSLARAHRLAPFGGTYGLKSLQANRLKASQIEAVRRAILRKLRKIGQIWIRTFPYKPISNKPTKTRMGKGKGNVQYWVCPVKPGQILFEIRGGISKEVAKEILSLGSQKLPVLTKFVTYESAPAGRRPAA
jgi:large subunit ribosomal protein L16